MKEFKVTEVGRRRASVIADEMYADLNKGDVLIKAGEVERLRQEVERLKLHQVEVVKQAWFDAYDTIEQHFNDDVVITSHSMTEMAIEYAKKAREQSL